jgi:hypothetical protein
VTDDIGFKKWLDAKSIKVGGRVLPWACIHGSQICRDCAEKMRQEWKRERVVRLIDL